jgi:hypothetical protein
MPKKARHEKTRNEAFAHFTKTNDAIHTILVTTYGLKENKYSGSFYAKPEIIRTFDDRPLNTLPHHTKKKNQKKAFSVQSFC